MNVDTDWSEVADREHAEWVASEREDELEKLRAENESLKKDSVRYRWLQKQTKYRFGKIQEACLIDATDVIYFKADEFDKLVDEEMGEQE